MKVIYATTVSEKNYCADMSRTRQVRTQMGSTACVICPFCHNKRDSDSLRKGIVMCANDDSEILTDTQFNEANPFGKEVDKVKEAVLLFVHKVKNARQVVVKPSHSHKYHFWEIKTAEPRRDSAIKKLALIWVGAKHSTNGSG